MEVETRRGLISEVAGPHLSVRVREIAFTLQSETSTQQRLVLFYATNCGQIFPHPKMEWLKTFCSIFTKNTHTFSYTFIVLCGNPFMALKM